MFLAQLRVCWEIKFRMFHDFRLVLLTLLLGGTLPMPGWAEQPSYTWTVLAPEKDSRPQDVREFDEIQSKTTVRDMNATDEVFHHRLTWQKVPIKDLLSASAPFCEFDFDAVKPQTLTAKEKTILREYLSRGGFILLSQDVYPYTREEYWPVKSWPVIDFFTKELPAADTDFKVERITEKHPIFHEYYKTRIVEPEKLELQENPNCPDFTLITYRGRPCIFIYGTYVCDGVQWITLPRPFGVLFTVSTYAEDNALDVNLYIYASMH